MAKIKIEDLPVLEELSEAKIKGIFGGMSPTYDPGLTPVDPIRGSSRSELDAMADEGGLLMEKDDTTSENQPGCDEGEALRFPSG